VDKPERFAYEAHIPRGSADANYIIVDGAEHVAVCDEAETAERLVTLLNSAAEVLDALRALVSTARTFRNVPAGEQQWTSLDDEALKAAFAAVAKAEGRP
jgi:hypothetical protein